MSRNRFIIIMLSLILFLIPLSTAFARTTTLDSSNKTVTIEYTGVLKLGLSGSYVTALQQRLKELGFYNGSCDGKFGPDMENAVKAFQKAHSLKVDGVIGETTFNAIFGIKETYKLGKLNNQITLRKGSTGANVKDLQAVLKMKGFYSGEITGNFQSETLSAVMRFQRSVGLKMDGLAANYTLSALYTMLNPPELSTISPWPNGKNAYNGMTIEKLLWSDVSCSIFKRCMDADIVDIGTGYVFHVRRTGGSKHADVETLTPLDTATFYKSVGNFSWDRRPVWVIVNGHRLAASMNCMPHGYDTISGNDFKGQFCIHFVDSKTHGSNKVDPDHQVCIEQAYRAGLIQLQ